LSRPHLRGLVAEPVPRVADFLELAELMCLDALHPAESRGGHFRFESQTAEGEAKRDDANFCYVAAWEWTGPGKAPILPPPRHRPSRQSSAPVAPRDSANRGHPAHRGCGRGSRIRRRILPPQQLVVRGHPIHARFSDIEPAEPPGAIRYVASNATGRVERTHSQTSRRIRAEGRWPSGSTSCDTTAVPSPLGTAVAFWLGQSQTRSA
jgi:hypothetical protein